MPRRAGNGRHQRREWEVASTLGLEFTLKKRICFVLYFFVYFCNLTLGRNSGETATDESVNSPTVFNVPVFIGRAPRKRRSALPLRGARVASPRLA